MVRTFLSRPDTFPTTRPQKTTYKIDTVQSFATGSLVTTLTDTNTARGDAYSVSIGDQAYLVGGFSHINRWCEALSSVEQYDIDADMWKAIAPLTYNRGDKALVALGSKIYAIGGESNTDCSADPGQRTSPTTEVEVLDTDKLMAGCHHHNYRARRFTNELTQFVFIL